MALTDKVKLQWAKQPNGFLRIIAFGLAIAILVLVHTILSDYMSISRKYVGVFQESGDKTFNSESDKGSKTLANETAPAKPEVPIYIVGDKKHTIDSLVKALSLGSMHGMNFVDIVSAGNVFALVFFLVSYITGESELSKRLTTEICFDIAHAIFNAVAGSLLMNRRDHPVQVIEDQPSLLITGVLFLVLAVVLFIDAIYLVGFQNPEGLKATSLLMSIKTDSD